MSVSVLDGVSAFPKSCLPFCLSLSPTVSPHVCLCGMVCRPSRGLVSPCLPLSPHICVPVLDGVSAFPRSCLPLSPHMIPHPLKCILRGGSREFSYISRAPPPLKRVFLYELVFVKLRDYLKRWGVFLIHFQYLASKACLEKGGEAVSYIDFARPLIFDAHGVSLGNLTK